MLPFPWHSLQSRDSAASLSGGKGEAMDRKMVVPCAETAMLLYWLAGSGRL